MSRYIKDTDVYKLVEPNGTARVHCSQIDELPRADVAPVRHGEWKDRYENKYANHYYECSLCNGNALDKVKNSWIGKPESIQVCSPYCPHCGAKMDGERKEK